MQGSYIAIPGLRLILPFVLLGTCLAAHIALVEADDGSREKIDGDLILMQGKWDLVDFVYYRDNIAKRIPKGQRQGTRTVGGNRYRLKLRIGPLQVDKDYSFRLYSQQKPKAFDVTFPDGETVVKGIYEVNADTLRRAYSQPGDPRPTQFEAGNQTYQIWKRIVDRPTEVKNQRVDSTIKPNN